MAINAGEMLCKTMIDYAFKRTDEGERINIIDQWFADEWGAQIAAMHTLINFDSTYLTEKYSLATVDYFHNEYNKHK